MIKIDRKSYSTVVSAEEKFEDKWNCIYGFNANSVQEQLDRINAELQEADVDKHIKIDIQIASVAIKDNIAVKGVTLSAGSNMLKDFVSPYDATVIKKLKDSYFIPYGRTNMDEFGMGSSTSTSFVGKAENPVQPNTSPGGSSGGSAAAVAAGYVSYALGSDTGGSIRQPAAYCGIVGLKPTYGVVSRHGLVSYCSSFDTIGVFAKDTDKAFDLFNTIRGHDINDNTSIDTTGMYEGKFNPHLPKTIGVIREHFGKGLSKELNHSISIDVINKMRHMGVKVVYFDSKYLKYATSVYYIIAMAEASSNLGRYDGIRYCGGAKDSNFDKLITKNRTEGFGEEVKRRIILGTHILSSGYSDKYYIKAQQVRALIKQEMDEFLSQVDCIVSPVTTQLSKPFVTSNVDPLEEYLADLYTVPANLCGLPAVSAPIYRKDPFKHSIRGNFQLMGKPFSEKELCEWANRIKYIYNE